MSDRPTVVIADVKTTDSDVQRETFEDFGADVTVVDGDDGSFIEQAMGAIAIVPDANTHITDAVLSALPTVEVIGRAGIGLDNVDLEAASRHGVTVVNVPEYCLEEVAVHTLSLMLSCFRRLKEYDRDVANGTWRWERTPPIPGFSSETIGLVAFGNIPRTLASMLAGFDVDIVAYDPYVDDAVIEDHGVRPVGFETLLESAGIVSIHTPLTADTEDMFDASTFERMREGSILINTARGPIVNESDLIDALESGPLLAAGIDVLPDEPRQRSPLFGRRDVIVTPHAAWYSDASRERLSRRVARNVIEVLEGGRPAAVVDGPIWD